MEGYGAGGMGSGPAGNGFQFGSNDRMLIPKYSNIGNGEYLQKALELGLPPDQLYPEPGIIVIFSTDINDQFINPVTFVPDSDISATLQQVTDPKSGAKLPIYYISGSNDNNVTGIITILNPNYTNIFMIGSGGRGYNSGVEGGGGSGGLAIYANSTMDPNIFNGTIKTGNYRISITPEGSSLIFTSDLSETFNSKPYTKSKLISSNKKYNVLSSFNTKYAPIYESYDLSSKL